MTSVSNFELTSPKVITKTSNFVYNKSLFVDKSMRKKRITICSGHLIKVKYVEKKMDEKSRQNGN